MQIRIEDHSQEVLDQMFDSVVRALEKCGLVAEGYAKQLCPVDTGNLRNSITHAVDADHGECLIGTPTEYAVYVELGTGIYTEGGRTTPWVYQDAKGRFHITRGSKAQPFIKPAVSDHAQTYRDIIEQEMHS